jgi:dTDP-4-amino-4,6-dideoxygalactose transaminase
MNAKIPFVDLNAHYQAHRTEFDAALAEVIAKSAFIGGDAHKAFATEFAEWCGGGYVALTGNGTDAIELALHELLGPGDGTGEVLTVSHTFIATAEAISRTGYRPVFVDVDPDTLLMDLSTVEKAITPRTRAILPVHLYGQMVDMPRLAAIAKAHRLAVVEDAAQAHGARFDGYAPGALSDAATFSFYPGKNLGAWGDAGAVYSRNADLIERITMRANHGRLDKYLHEFEGVSSRMDGLQAAILRVKLRHLDDATAARQRIAAKYDTLFRDTNGVTPVSRDPKAVHVYHLYVVRVRDREKAQSALAAQGISTGIHYPVPLHMQPAYRRLGHAPQDFPETERAASEILSLPMYPEMTDAQVETVAAALKEAL